MLTVLIWMNTVRDHWSRSNSSIGVETKAIKSPIQRRLLDQPSSHTAAVPARRCTVSYFSCNEVATLARKVSFYSFGLFLALLHFSEILSSMSGHQAIDVEKLEESKSAASKLNYYVSFDWMFTHVKIFVCKNDLETIILQPSFTLSQVPFNYSATEIQEPVAQQCEYFKNISEKNSSFSATSWKHFSSLEAAVRSLYFCPLSRIHVVSSMC